MIVLFSIITVSVATPGCTSGGGASPTARSPADISPTPAPTPLPAWYFTPKMAGWPFNVTDNASFSYTFTNYNVKPDPYVRDDSYTYTTLAASNSTPLLHLVYRTMSREKTQVPTQYDIYYDKATGEILNATRGTGPEGQVTGISDISKDTVAGIDLRSNRSDWNSIRETAGNETVTVPAGTFNCTKYIVRYNATFVSGAIWMADFVPAPVKREMYNETGQAGAIYELTGYSLS